MKEQKIVIDIGPDGSLRLDADGFSGDACIAEIEKLLEATAGLCVRVDRKPEAGRANLTVKPSTKIEKRGGA